MGKLSKKKIKIVCAASVAFFSLISMTTGVFAWFTSLASVDKASDNFVITTPKTMTSTYDLYYRNTTTKAVVKVPESTENIDLSLQAFNTSVCETNALFNNILRIVITFTDTSGTDTKSVTSKISCTQREIGSAYNVGPAGATRTYNDNAGFTFHYKKTGEEEADFICDYISNLIQFKGFLYSYNIGETKYLPSSDRPCLVDTEKRIDYTSDETLFTTAKAIFDERDDQKTFFNGTSKLTNFNMDFAGIPAAATKVEYFVEYNYNNDLISTYFVLCEHLKNRQFDGKFDPTKANLNVTFLKDLVSIELNATK